MGYDMFLCPVDIRNQLYEAGVFQDNEDVVIIAGKCALLEQVNAGIYRYRAVNIETLKIKYLCTRKMPFRQEDYPKIADRLLGLDINQPESSIKLDVRSQERARLLLCRIFDETLPQHNMARRQKQKELALSMLQALQERKLALCEAEVGTGKTHAYILAVTVYNLYSFRKTTTVISTSTIALQEALTKEYIPQISKILMQHRIIERPLSFVVRKGKSHYVCDSRLQTYESSVRNLNRLEDSVLLGQLEQLWAAQDTVLDLDRISLTAYVMARINVSQCGGHCPHFSYCRYAAFSKKWMSEHYDFQITNHNYVLADIMNRKNGKKRLLPAYRIAVFDEAHKLMDAARQIYATSLDENEIPKLVKLIVPDDMADMQLRIYMSTLCSGLREQNQELFRFISGYLVASHSREDMACIVGMDARMRLRILDMLGLLTKVKDFFWKLGFHNGHGRINKAVRCIQDLSEKMDMFLGGERNICWAQKNGNGVIEICAIPRMMDAALYRDLWCTDIQSIITSGTMSVRGDFSHFKKMTGIGLMQPAHKKVLETAKASPFDYSNHAILYIPERMPFPDIRENSYIRAISIEIIRLVRATSGHTLILFSSYWLMERLYFEIGGELSPFPLFQMKRGRTDVIESFRRSGNGVLFASDSAGEGIDLPGDILSSVIVVKLPFPVPDPVLEAEREKYQSFDSYMKAVIVPGMIIKLRQWFGRGIRRETDTAVFSILDSRAGLFGKFRDEILTALPSMPVTDRIGDVERFIKEKKDGTYFIPTDMKGR